MFEKKLRNQKSYGFKPHYSHEKVEEGLKNNTLFEGVIWKTERNPDIAYVTLDGLNIDVIIQSVQDQNRSLDWDRVVIELNDPSLWQK